MVAQITLHEKKHSELSVRQATVLVEQPGPEN